MVGFKQNWDKLAKIIFPKPKIVISSEEPIPNLSPRRGALHAPADSNIGRGTPCVPAGTESAEAPVDLGERYTVLSKLGQGGSASVYKVKDKELDKTFAVKILRSELLPDSQAQLRFKQEAEAASCLTHPNLVSVYASGIASDKAPYLVMDCLSGKTLAQTLKEEGALDRARAIDILTQCCEALVHMHMKGIVHRDIKPSNIFLTKAENGTDLVKIVDFGIAKIQAYQDSTHLTQTGAVFGSPLYMSPEQCRGEPLDFRSDIYSLGCVAYEMLTGISPFAASNPIKTIIKHISGSVTPPRDAAPQYQIPEALEAIVMRCLETESKARYQTVDGLLQHLETLKTAGKLKIVRNEIIPSFYRRFAASILDGTILTALIVAGTYLFALTQHQPFPLHWDFTSLRAHQPGGCEYFLASWALFTAIFGPASTTIWCFFHYSKWDTAPGQFIALLLIWFYFVPFETSKLCGTPGKRILGMAVVNSHGERLSASRATARFFSKMFLLPLLSLENSIRIVPRIGESLFMRFLRYGKELVFLLANPPKPPTDDFTKTYVINASAFQNPYLTNLEEHLGDETKGLKNLNEINEKLKIVKGALYWNIGFSLLVILILISSTITSKKAPDGTTLGTWIFWLAYISVWATPAFIYYHRYNRRKQQLLKARNKNSITKDL